MFAYGPLRIHVCYHLTSGNAIEEGNERGKYHQEGISIYGEVQNWAIRRAALRRRSGRAGKVIMTATYIKPSLLHAIVNVNVNTNQAAIIPCRSTSDSQARLKTKSLVIGEFEPTIRVNYKYRGS